MVGWVHTASLGGVAEVRKHSANEHEESRLVAHDGDVSLAGRGCYEKT